MKLDHVKRNISDVTGGNHENEGLKKTPSMPEDHFLKGANGMPGEYKNHPFDKRWIASLTNSGRHA